MQQDNKLSPIFLNERETTEEAKEWIHQLPTNEHKEKGFPQFLIADTGSFGFHFPKIKKIEKNVKIK